MLNQLISQVSQYIPRDSKEETEKKILLCALKTTGAQLLSRNREEMHLTASAFVMNPALDKLLMVHHNIYHSFSFPGGHADQNPKLWEVARKELIEETGITDFYPLSSQILGIDFLPVPEHKKNGKIVKSHTHCSVTYGFIAAENQPLFPNAGENSAVCWILYEELKTYCIEGHMLPVYRKLYTRMLDVSHQKEKVYQDLPKRLLPWYEENARPLPWRKDNDPYHVWVSEIMLQQTRVEAVQQYYIRFLQHFPTVYELAAAPEEQLLKLWEGLGYYSRARNLHKTAKIIVSTYGGKFPDDYQKLLSLPGIGPYTAGAIASICFEKPCAAVDGNVFRVVARAAECYKNISDTQTKKDFSDILSKNYPLRKRGAFTQSLMELGATICLPNQQPQCDRCPIESICMARFFGVQQLLPVKAKKEKQKVVQKSVFICIDENRIAIRRRESKGLLAGLWEFPNLDGTCSESELPRLLKNWGVQLLAPEKIINRTHIFTHLKWEMTCFYSQCKNIGSPFEWVTKEELEKKYTLPSAFQKCILPEWDQQQEEKP